MSKPRNVEDALNKALADVALIRHTMKDGRMLNKKEYYKVNQCLMLLGKLRFEYLDYTETHAA